MLQEVISRYPPRCRGAPAESPVHRGFSGARIARVRAPAGEFCLRGWPAGTPPHRPRNRGLHRLLAFVQQAGVAQVPVPVCSESGETLVEVRGRCWQLEPWMQGLADFHSHPSAARLRSAMAVLAAFHRAAARFEPQIDESPWFASQAAAPSPAVLERRRQLREWERGKLGLLKQRLCAAADSEFRRLAVDVVDCCGRLGASVAAQLDAAAALTFRLTPCIRDVWHDHVLFTGDTVTGLIDLAACRSESVAADLARLVGSLAGDDAGQWDLALAAYQQQRPLSVDELGLVPVLDRSGVLLSGLAWLDRRYLRQDETVEVPRVCERLGGIVGRLRRMAA
ncbi:MAG TPA: phosphotransferase [Planctomycetaceae bacterium]|nr:phosphotransferase [Planctomycetaceae bacterium]